MAAEAASVWQEVLLPVAQADLPNPLVFANYAAHGDLVWRHGMLSSFAACRPEYPEVKLLRYPSGTVVDASQDHATLVGGAFVEEQVPDWGQDDAVVLASLARGRATSVRVRQESLLLARYGETVWGHWIFELLAKAVLAERAYPGRFQFLVGAHAASPLGGRSYRDSVMESLAAYGIGAERIVTLDRRRQYRFDALFDVSGISQKPQRTHPELIEALRRLPILAALPGNVPRLAVCRNRSRYRSIHNFAVLRPWLADHGFLEVDLEQTPFPIQVELFRQAEFVIASLGSDCTSLVHCRPGTRVITLAPAGWPDDYFAKLLQSGDFILGDLRGPSTRIGSNDVALTSHLIDPGKLTEAFEQVSAFSSRAPPARVAEVDGDIIPRYRLREVARIDFGANGNESALLGTGWGDAEASLRWSIGPFCTLHLPAGFLPAIELLLEIEGINAVAPPHLVSKPLHVCLNGRQIATFTTLHHDRLYCKIAAQWIGDDGLELVFRHPLCPSPRSLGLGDDDRSLGFGFAHMRFFDPLP